MRDIVRQSGVSFATRVVGLAVAFFSNILLARLLGPSGYGAYAIAIGWASLLAIPARLGLDNVALRFVTLYRERREVGALRGLLSSSARAIFLASICAAAVALLAAAVMGRGEIDPLLAVAVGLLVFPLAAMGWLSAVIRSFARIFASQAYEQLVRPLLLIAMLAATWLSGWLVDAPLALGLTWLAIVVPLAVLAGQVRCEVAALGDQPPTYADRRLWMAVSWPLFLLSLFQEASNQIDLLLLGALKDAASAAQFAAAMRLTSLASFGLVAIVSVSAPTIASAFHGDDQTTLAKIATMTARLSLLFALLIVVVLVIFGRLALAAFGPTFSEAYPVLVILCLASLISASTGSVGYYLLMTGNERIAAAIMVVALLVAAAMDVLLIPIFGAIGAAIGSASGLAAWNLAMLIIVRQRLGIDCSPFGVHARS